jgi:polar amino acid transport system ATP-binding protein
MLIIENLSLSKKKKNILRRVSLRIATGGMYLLLGKSGSGKTSLLRCISQLDTGYEGAVTYQNQNLSQLPAKNRSQLIGFVSQTFSLFSHMTVLENCIHPLCTVLRYTREEALIKAQVTLLSLDIVDVCNSYPHEISGGQMQRAAIARALVMDPLFLLFDEPTSALDPGNRNRFISIVKELQKQGKGILISTHDMELAQILSPTTFSLDTGKMMENH